MGTRPERHAGVVLTSCLSLAGSLGAGPGRQADEAAKRAFPSTPFRAIPRLRCAASPCDFTTEMTRCTVAPEWREGTVQGRCRHGDTVTWGKVASKRMWKPG